MSASSGSKWLHLEPASGPPSEGPAIAKPASHPSGVGDNNCMLFNSNSVFSYIIVYNFHSNMVSYKVQDLCCYELNCVPLEKS